MFGRFLVLLLFGALSPAVARADAASDDAFLDDLQRRTFAFFWETTPADNGLTPDRWPSESPCSVAAVGLGLTSVCVGESRGWVTREEAAGRVLTTLRFLRDAPQSEDPRTAAGWRGFYYHFLDSRTGLRWRDCELSSMDTALLMMGVLACREHFGRDVPVEADIRATADALYRRVEWDWMQPRPPLVAMAWRPERGGFEGADYRGYDEALSLYALAIGSPTHPIDPAAWAAFTDDYTWAEFYGRAHVNFEPLFGHQHPFCWIDPRGLTDRYMRERGIDYAENSRRATLAQRDYAIDNPQGWRGYGADLWGLTACDGPADVEREHAGEPRRFFGYRARGASAERIVDDGTVAPPAAGASIPFAPQEAVAVLRAMRDRYGDRLYGEYGFRNALNPTFRYADARVQRGTVDPQDGWIDSDYLGLDQGPILLMAENHRTGFVWDLMRNSPYLRDGLRRAGFEGGPLSGVPPER